MVRLATRLSGGGAGGVDDPNQVMGTDLTGWWQVGELTVDDGAGGIISIGNQATGVTKTLDVSSGDNPALDLTGGPNGQPRAVFATASGVMASSTAVELSPAGGALHTYVLMQTDTPTITPSQSVVYRLGSAQKHVTAFINSFVQSKYLSPANKDSLLVNTSTDFLLASTEWDGALTHPKVNNVYMDAGDAMSGTQDAVDQVHWNFGGGGDGFSIACVLATKVQPSAAQHTGLLDWFNDVYDLGLS